MKGSEKQVLNIIKELGEADKESVAFKLGISSEYIAEICQGLVKEGYLIESGNEKYKLTPQGLKAISPVRTRGPIAVLKGGG